MKQNVNKNGLIVLGILFVVILAYGVYTWDKNQELNRNQSYVLERSSECRTIAEKKRGQYEDWNIVGNWYYSQFRYIENEDICAFETEHVMSYAGDDARYNYQTIYYDIQDIFTEEALGGYTKDSQGNFSGDTFQCESYNTLRFEYFKDTVGSCS